MKEGKVGKMDNTIKIETGMEDKRHVLVIISKKGSNSKYKSMENEGLCGFW
jgi:hypothetical protein